jgi:hypothetical protein
MSVSSSFQQSYASSAFFGGRFFWSKLEISKERFIQINPLPIKNLLLFTFTYIIGKLQIVLIKDTFNKVTVSLFLAFKFRSRTNRPASIFGGFHLYPVFEPAPPQIYFPSFFISLKKFSSRQTDYRSKIMFHPKHLKIF